MKQSSTRENSFVRQTSFKGVQGVSRNSSFVIRHSRKEDARGPARNGGSRIQSVILSCHNSSHQI
jgi:hypothetical protein